MNTTRRAVLGTILLLTRVLGALMLLAGCGSDEPVRYQTQWNFIRSNCTEAFPPGDKRMDCVARGVEAIMPPTIVPASGFACNDAGPYKVCAR